MVEVKVFTWDDLRRCCEDLQLTPLEIFRRVQLMYADLSRRERIVAYLREHGSPARSYDVARATGIPSNQFSGIIRDESRVFNRRKERIVSAGYARLALKENTNEDLATRLFNQELARQLPKIADSLPDKIFGFKKKDLTDYEWALVQQRTLV